MEATSQQRQAIGDDELRRMLALMKDSDSVELKLTVPEAEQRSTIGALGIDAVTAQIRQVYFLDTPDLRLNTAGVVARVRRVQGKPADAVVKLRPIVPSKVPKSLRLTPGFSVEVDAMPGGFVCSGSLKGVSTNDQVRDAAAGRIPARKLFSREQRAFYAEHAPAGMVLDELRFLGPIFVLKVKWVPGRGLRPLTAELWLYPDGTRILELSTKCLPSEGLQVAAETRMRLLEYGIDLSGEQATKTKKALEYFAGHQLLAA